MLFQFWSLSASECLAEYVLQLIKKLLQVHLERHFLLNLLLVKIFPLYPGHILFSVGAENTYLNNMNTLMSQLHVQCCFGSLDIKILSCF